MRRQDQRTGRRTSGTATLTTSAGIAASICSCPVGGRHKHVAALLLAWLAEPDAFREVEPLETALERRDKAVLLALNGG